MSGFGWKADVPCRSDNACTVRDGPAIYRPDVILHLCRLTVVRHHTELAHDIGVSLALDLSCDFSSVRLCCLCYSYFGPEIRFSRRSDGRPNYLACRFPSCLVRRKRVVELVDALFRISRNDFGIAFTHRHTNACHS